jgi:hypothetical protein
MLSIQIRSNAACAGNVATVLPGCTVCQGPLLQAAFIAPALGVPAQHISDARLAITSNGSRQLSKPTQL